MSSVLLSQVRMTHPLTGFRIDPYIFRWLGCQSMTSFYLCAMHLSVFRSLQVCSQCLNPVRPTFHSSTTLEHLFPFGCSRSSLIRDFVPTPFRVTCTWLLLLRHPSDVFGLIWHLSYTFSLPPFGAIWCRAVLHSFTRCPLNKVFLHVRLVLQLHNIPSHFRDPLFN